jgi:hypothetical protein
MILEKKKLPGEVQSIVKGERVSSLLRNRFQDADNGMKLARMNEAHDGDEDDTRIVVPLLKATVNCTRSSLNGPRLMLLLAELPLRLLVKKLCMPSCAFAATSNSPVS